MSFSILRVTVKFLDVFLITWVAKFEILDTISPMFLVKSLEFKAVLIWYTCLD